MESANSDQPMKFASFQGRLWDETHFDTSANMASNQTVAVPPNHGNSSNYNDGPWSNAVTPSPAMTSDVLPYSAPPYPPDPNKFHYMQYPFPYSESSSPPAQDHMNVLVSETQHLIYSSRASSPTAHNPLPLTSSHGGISASPLSSSTPVSPLS